MTTVTTTLREIKCHMADNFSRNLEQFDTQTETLKPDHENPSTRIGAFYRKKKSKKRKKTWMREKTKTSQKRVEQAPRVAASSMFAPQR